MAEIEALDSVRFAVVNEGTVRLLDALVKVARTFEMPDFITVTSATDGVHSGLADPHHIGHALDIRSHNFPDAATRAAFVAAMAKELGDRFFIFLEDPGSPNEHFHVQVRRGVVYPPLPTNVGTPRKV